MLTSTLSYAKIALTTCIEEGIPIRTYDWTCLKYNNKSWDLNIVVKNTRYLSLKNHGSSFQNLRTYRFKINT